MLGLIWIQTFQLKEFFEKKKDFEKIIRRQRSMQNYPVGKEKMQLINNMFYRWRRSDLSQLCEL